MRLTFAPLLALALTALPQAPAAAGTALLCRIVADAGTGRILLEEGADCGRRVTPASTFKIPLAVMGYDAGLLTSAEEPVMRWRQGEPDWGGDLWKGEVTPERWMHNSVVWYSQRLTRELGAARLRGYAAAFGYGNADFAGDPGFDNGLERAWIASSLEIAPREQVVFLTRLLAHDLPVSARAQDQAMALVETREAAGWTIHGKTGAAFPRLPNRDFDRARGYGWFVGWAELGDRRVVFAKLTQDDAEMPESPGRRARDAMLADWGRIATAIGG